MEYIRYYESSLGRILLVGDGEALTGLRFEGQKVFADSPARTAVEKNLPVFAEAERWLDIYFSGSDPGFTPEIRLCATAFRKTVWDVLLTVPYGTTVTYGEIADCVAGRMNLPRMSAQAVGGAVGHNPVSLIIPCHRVVGKDGSLTGYAGGLERKRKLLEMERRIP